MLDRSLLLAIAAVLAVSSAPSAFAQTATAAEAPQAGGITAEAANDAALATPVDSGSSAAVLRAQVLLARAHFSPGEIDAGYGSNTRRAIAGFQRAHGLTETGTVDAETWAKLNADTGAVLIPYTLTEQDVAGPFVSIPRDMVAKSKLEKLGYASPMEALGEKFHASPRLLQRLNPGKSFAVGESVLVPNVTQGELPKAAKVIVDKSDATVSVVDAQDKVLAQFPASMGSAHDPLPLGEWKINGVAQSPTFHYNPKLFWDANPEHSKATIAPGPNNPVGEVWIDLSKEHYGIHGTPEPANIGKTQSHGCIRLTNWDARALATAVAPGIPAVLQE